MKRITSLFVTAVTVGFGAISAAQADGLNGSDSAGAANKRSLTKVELLSRLSSASPDILESLGTARVAELLSAYEASTKSGILSHSCEVIDGDTGVDDGTIDTWSTFEIADWLFYSSGGVASNTVTFIMLPLFAPSAMNLIVQRFDVSGSPATSIITPAGVPFWGGNLNDGDWILVVTNDSGEPANFCFTSVTS